MHCNHFAPDLRSSGIAPYPNPSHGNPLILRHVFNVTESNDWTMYCCLFVLIGIYRRMLTLLRRLTFARIGL
jgi:hypothetical protein